MKLSDYVIRYLADYGVRHIFMVTGGGAMHLNDSIGKESRIQYICNHHEQACAMAAEGYARVSGKIGVICVTTGPGGINALNGVFGAWTDSIPMFIISGQVKRETCMGFNNVPGLRQLGDQETDIISMVKGITKYAVLIREPESIRYHLEKALHLATSGRPGPCWLDIPTDIQAALIDETVLREYDSLEDQLPTEPDRLDAICDEVIDRITDAQRPVILVGTGVRLAKVENLLLQMIEELGVPVCTAWTAHDLIPSDHRLYAGRPGSVGDRPGNFAVQNSDLLLVLGSRLNIRQVSYNWNSFGKNAFKIQVDVDEAELRKPTTKINMQVWADLKDFLPRFMDGLAEHAWDSSRFSGWVAWCKERVTRYPVITDAHQCSGKYVNPYLFVQELFSKLTDQDIVVCGNGSACVIPFQVGAVKQGLRMFANSGCASMGYDLPAAIGAAVAADGKRVVCLAGDGSLMMNIQELQTLRHCGWPLKLFVLNNTGYSSIRQTQQGFFGRLVGEGPGSGVSFPDFCEIAKAFGIHALYVDASNFIEKLDEILEITGPVLCNVLLDPNQEFKPKLSSRVLPDGTIVSLSLEDMYPFLDRQELLSNLLIPPLELSNPGYEES